MAVNDNGPKPSSFDLENETKANQNYRTVAWSGKYLQVTLMSIPVGESIGLEQHPETDQFVRLDAGKGLAKIGDSKDDLAEFPVSDGWCVLVPAGKWHDITNVGNEPMQLYTVYAPVHHAAGIVQQTADDAEADEDAGRDEPPAWSHQPEPEAEDQKG